MYVPFSSAFTFAKYPVQLSVIYRQASSTAEQCWYLIGYGIRAAQDIGLNRRNPDLKPTVENELRKRVFWMFIFADILSSAAVGRPPAIELSEYVVLHIFLSSIGDSCHCSLDLELPIDCDDEYWENPNPDLAFKQPAGVPSRVSCFRSMINLVKIHHTVQRAFVSWSITNCEHRITQPRLQYSATPKEPPPGISAAERDRLALANIDSALNAWVDSVPGHRASESVFKASNFTHFHHFLYSSLGHSFTKQCFC